MNYDRIHAREPTHDRERWTTGVVEHVDDRDGHVVFTVTPEDGDDGESGAPLELTVTHAVRDLVLRRLDIDEGASPVGERVWYRKHGTSS